MQIPVDMGIVVLLLLFCCAIPLWAQSQLAPPPDVNSVFVKARTETELTLQWTKRNNCSYTLRYSNGTETPLTVSTNASVLTHTVTGLSPGTKYTFTMYTVFKRVKSSGFNFTAVTKPSNIVRASVKARSETAVTLEWNKVNNSNSYIYILRQNNKTEEYTPMYWGGSVATHTVSSLSPGSKYNLTIYTVFGGERSSGYNFSVVTRPVDVERVNATQRSENSLVLSWKSVDTNNVSYVLRYSNGTEVSIMELDKGSPLTHVASSLAPGTKYKFTLYTVFEDVRSRGLNFSSATASFSVTGLRCERLFRGTVLILIWNAPIGPWTEVEVYMKGRRQQYTNETRHEFHGLVPAFWYNMTVKLHSGDMKTVPVSIRCQTDPRVVIIAAVLAILCVIFLVCLGVCIHRKRKTQTDTQANHTSVQDLEEGPCNAPVMAKPHSSTCKKQRGQGSSEEKSIRCFQNPYSTPRVP